MAQHRSPLCLGMESETAPPITRAHPKPEGHGFSRATKIQLRKSLPCCRRLARVETEGRNDQLPSSKPPITANPYP